MYQKCEFLYRVENAGVVGLLEHLPVSESNQERKSLGDFYGTRSAIRQ